jgi:hypothetical protein
LKFFLKKIKISLKLKIYKKKWKKTKLIVEVADSNIVGSLWDTGNDMVFLEYSEKAFFERRKRVLNLQS